MQALIHSALERDSVGLGASFVAMDQGEVAKAMLKL